MIFPYEKKKALINGNKPASVLKLKTKQCKLKSSVNWQGVLEQKGIKQGLGVLSSLPLAQP